MSPVKKSKVHIMKHENPDPLGLKNLPELEPSTDLWPDIKQSLTNQTKVRRRWKAAGFSLAAAAALLLVVGLADRFPGVGDGPDTGRTEPQVVQTDAAMEEAPTPVESLIALSQRLEVSLQGIRTRSPLSETSSLVHQVELEDLVAQVDEQLSQHPGSAELWRQRVVLLLDLTRLHRNELRRESVQLASL